MSEIISRLPLLESSPGSDLAALSDPSVEKAIKSAVLIGRLDVLKGHFEQPTLTYAPEDSRCASGLDEDAATYMRLQVEDVYYSIPREVRDAHLGSIAGRSYGEVGRQTKVLSSMVRADWRREHYLPRTRAAEATDFEAWLEAYVDKYGMEALAKTRRVDGDFERTYHPFGRESNEALRLPLQDIVLVAAYGSSAVSVLDDVDSDVSIKDLGTLNHHRLYSLDVAPEDFFGHINVPADIERQLNVRA